jgi:Leucine-rich repeat (LRR) protein
VRGEISDISPKKDFLNLKYLSFHLTGYNRVSDFNYLLKLINLKGFNLSGIQISDLSPLDNLTNLTDLDLSDNHISDMPPLVNLTNLTELRLRSNPITDITLVISITAPYIKGHKLRKKIRNYEYENDRQRH